MINSNRRLNIARLILWGSVLISSKPASAQSTLHVDLDNCPNQGNGSAIDPFCSIQDCIDESVDGDECVVEPGTYLEIIDFDSKAITLRSSGGAEITTIDAFGSGTAVTCAQGEGPDTVLDGFRVINGSATSASTYKGGGMRIYSSSPVVRNCIFEDNAAVADIGFGQGLGGGMVCNFESHPLIQDCVFRNNSAVGGVFELTGIGGGLACLVLSNPTLIGCTFENNVAIADASWSMGGPSGHGGGLAALSGSAPVLVDCVFDGNETVGNLYGSGFGAGAFISDPVTDVTITNCVFKNGLTSGKIFGAGAVGGVVVQNCAAATIRGCRFENNYSAQDLGGAMLIFMKVTNDVECTNVPPSVIDCEFIENVSDHDQAGALAIVGYSDPKITGCKFLGNSSMSFGGAVVVGFNSSPIISNCLFAGNSSAYGGAMWFGVPPPPIGDPTWFSHPTVSNCTLTDNFASEDGGGIYSTQEHGGTAAAVIYNSIVWGNEPNDIIDTEGAFSTVSYSDVGGGWAGTGNIDSDPMFVDGDGPDGDADLLADNDYRPAPGSPCIDVGNNLLVAEDACDWDNDGDTTEPTPVDLDGHARFVDDPETDDCPPDPEDCGTPPIVDMGAYEFGVCGTDLDDDGVIGPADLAVVLGNWGPYGPCPPYHVADISGDCEVGPADLAQILGTWGPCR